MIDIHCHILPAVDDGPSSLDEAVMMARLAAASGVRRIVATPHQLAWDPTAIRNILAGVQRLQRELHLAGIGLSLTTGCELRLGPELLLESGNERLHTLNRSRYLLVELPAAEFPPYTEALIFELQVRGLVPVVAHPERNAAIQEDPDRYVRLVERGVMGQLTASSLSAAAERRTRQTAERLLRRGLVHVLASDAHDADQRAPDLAQGLAAVARIVGRQQAEAMVYRIPEAIWSDRDLVGHLPQPVGHAERSKQWRWLPIKLF